MASLTQSAGVPLTAVPKCGPPGGQERACSGLVSVMPWLMAERSPSGATTWISPRSLTASWRAWIPGA